VDLFSGCGGLSLGVREACRALRLRFDCALAVDINPIPLGVFASNLPTRRVVAGDVTSVLDGEFLRRPTNSERQLIREIGELDLLLGGPPCEGHSDFNNRTRHQDERNSLYLRMVRAAEVLEPRHIIIENVPGALNDKGRVVQRSMEILQKLGYSVSSGIIDMTRIGVPQKRKRLVVVASKSGDFDFRSLEGHATEPRTVAWAIDDLVDIPGSSLVDEVAASAPATRWRIEYLFEHGLYELPDSERPACHAQKRHTYKSIYGRLRSDKPAQTITSGFYSMCMGRYVHPSRPRTITAHEAARLQFFPDYFDFSSVMKRGELAHMIGDAVPMKLGYVVALELLR
jgi:DNA (cytosine-5)-methyltransferase 1